MPVYSVLCEYIPYCWPMWGESSTSSVFDFNEYVQKQIIKYKQARVQNFLKGEFRVLKTQAPTKKVIFKQKFLPTGNGPEKGTCTPKQKDTVVGGGRAPLRYLVYMLLGLRPFCAISSNKTRVMIIVRMCIMCT